MSDAARTCAMVTAQEALRSAVAQSQLRAVAVAAVSDVTPVASLFPGPWYRWSSGSWITLFDDATLRAPVRVPPHIRWTVFPVLPDVVSRIDTFAAENAL